MLEPEGLVGIGLYTASEASRLLRLQPARIRRWLGGYRGKDRTYAPLWLLSLPRLDGQLGLNFLDLMQLRVVARIIEQTDISLQKLRQFLLRSQEILEHDHPLATARFQTDGRRLFLEVGREADEPILYDVLGNQLGFHRIIEPSFKDVSAVGDELTAWWPLGKQRAVALDPRRSFGAPIVHPSGIPTAALAASAEREGSIRDVTRWYPVTEREVKDAVAFERQLAGSPGRRKAA